jgi:hypothetical protein
MKHINRNLTIPEIFKRVTALEGTIDEKAKLLAQFDRKDIRWVVDFMYNGEIDGVVVPEFKRSNRPVGQEYMTILTAIPKLNSALGNRHNKAVFDRNMIMVLENISGDESDLLVSLMNGKKVEGVSKAVFKRVYPAFFRESYSEIS